MPLLDIRHLTIEIDNPIGQSRGPNEPNFE